MKRDQRAEHSLLLAALLCIAGFYGMACFDETMKQPRRLGEKIEGSSTRVSTGRGAAGAEKTGGAAETGVGAVDAGLGSTETGAETATGAVTTEAGTTGSAER